MNGVAKFSPAMDSLGKMILFKPKINAKFENAINSTYYCRFVFYLDILTNTQKFSKHFDGYWILLKNVLMIIIGKANPAYIVGNELMIAQD